MSGIEKNLELPSLSMSSASHQQVQEDINEPANPNLPLVREEVQDDPPYSRYLTKQNITKSIVLLSLVAFTIWVTNNFLTQTFLKNRQPSSLEYMRSSNVPEVVSPDESDYRSFYFYTKMVEMAQKANKENRQISQQELKAFNEIKFKQFYNLFKVVRTIQLAKEFSTSAEESESNYVIPEDLNKDQYINKTEFFPEAVDQYGCGSCYSFPIAATIQYLYKFKYNITIKLSEQQLIDCSKDEPDANGCDDGNITKGFQYVRDVGLVSNQDYPYRSIEGRSYKCDAKTVKESKKYKISGFKILPPRNCEAIIDQLIKNNTVASMINTGNLNSYNGGTFTDCRREGLNHAITIVGQTEKNEWIVRNSWGKSWGVNGYFTMGHGNACGVCSHSIVPILELDPETGEAIKIDPASLKQKQKQNNEKRA